MVQGAGEELVMLAGWLKDVAISANVSITQLLA